jgi:catechol 2,3-dioxygenase-like lactoylglutathione lyase family enzyme
MRPSGDGDATARGDLSQDLDATVDFYTNLLGLIVTKDEGRRIAEDAN